MAEFIDHDRMVDNQMHRNQRIDFLCITAQLVHRIAHRGKVDHARYAGEILQQHAGRAVLDFAGGLGVLLPIDQRLHIMHRNGKSAIFEAQQIFEQYLHRKWQARHISQLFCHFLYGEIIHRLAASR